MLFQIAADASVPAITTQVGGPLTFLILFVYMALAEAYVLRQSEWGPLKEIAQAALLTNAISMVAVFILLSFIFEIWIGFVLAYFLTLVIEGVIFYYFRRGQWRRVLFSTFVTNSVSFVFLGSLMAISLK